MSDASKQEAENKDKTSSTPAHKEPKKTAVKKTTKRQPQKKSGTAVGWVAILLVLAATGLGYFAYTQLTQQINRLSTHSEQVKQGTSSLSTELQSATKQLDAELTSLTKNLDHYQQSSSDKIDLLQKQIGKNRRQWLIAEAEYLASFANTRLQLAGDLETALVALKAADQRLKDNGSPLVFPIREQIAKEINSLKNTETPDIVGLSSQLLALENAVSTMGISEPHAGTAQAPEIGQGDPSPIPESIEQTLNDAWENFSKLIVVRRSDKPMAALMTPERIELIRKNLALKLEAARLALINQHQTLFTESIAISKTWLSDYFDRNNPSVKTAIDELSQLENTVIKTELPSIALSLQMLRDLPLLTISEQDSPATETDPLITENPNASIIKKELNSAPITLPVEPENTTIAPEADTTETDI